MSIMEFSKEEVAKCVKVHSEQSRRFAFAEWLAMPRRELPLCFVAVQKKIRPTYVIVCTNLSIYYAQLFSMFNKRESIFSIV